MKTKCRNCFACLIYSHCLQYNEFEIQDQTDHFHADNLGTYYTDAINTLRPRRNGQHFADDIFKHIFFNWNVWISIKISLKFVPKGPIYNIPALVQIMAWRRPGDKPLSEPMRYSLPTHICVTRPYLITSVMNCCTKNDHEIIMYILSWYPYFALGTGCTGVGFVLKPKLYLYLRDIDTCICSNWLVANTRQNYDYPYIPCSSNWLLK